MNRNRNTSEAGTDQPAPWFHVFLLASLYASIVVFGFVRFSGASDQSMISFDLLTRVFPFLGEFSFLLMGAVVSLVTGFIQATICELLERLGVWRFLGELAWFGYLLITTPLLAIVL